MIKIEKKENWSEDLQSFIRMVATECVKKLPNEFKHSADYHRFDKESLKVNDVPKY
jgi:hypothetical protein